MKRIGEEYRKKKKKQKNYKNKLWIHFTNFAKAASIERLA
jgi:hypothetical protein